MCAGQDDDARRRLRPRLVVERAQDLRFLAAHNVGHAVRIAADEPGHDAKVRSGDGRQRRGEAVEVRGTVAIRRFDPALPTADHAAGDHRDALGNISTEERGQGLWEFAGLDALHAEWRALLAEDAAARIEAI